MSMPWRHRLRLLRRGLWYALAGALVLLALGNGIGSQLLPLAERHPDRIAAWLGARAQRPVAFDHVETEWSRRGPVLRLDNLRVGDPANPVRIGDAEVLVAQYAGLLPGRSFTELRVRGLDLTLQRDANGLWSVRGLPGQQPQAGGDPLDALERLGELQVSHARLHVLAPELGIDLQLPRIDLRMRVEGDRVRTGARAWLRDGGTPFEMALELDRRSGDGRVHAGSRRADLADLAGRFEVAGIGALAGRGRVQAWGRLQAHRVVAIRAVGELDGVALRGVPAVVGGAAPERVLGRLELDARWAGNVRQWSARADRLRLGDIDARQRLDGLAVQGGQAFGLQARRIDVGQALSLLALSDRLPAGLRGWLSGSDAGAVLEDVDLRGSRGGPLVARARIDGLHFAPVGTRPGMRGVSGWLQGDRDGLRLRFDPAARVAFDWPAGFGVVHEFTLDGEAVLWRDGAGWSVRTPGLAIDGGPFRADVRGGIGFQHDGSRPQLDIATDIADLPVSLAHGFWIHHLMPKATVDWLDAALQGGSLRDIHAVVAGDLDDWPFRNEQGMAGAGVFRADARIENGTLKFQPDWPAAERLDAHVSFVADGFSVAGKARIGGVAVPSLKAGIARFGEAELEVDAQASGDAKDFLAMLRASPLHREHAETLDNLRAGGAARAGFHMLLPLHGKRRAPDIEGDVVLADASLGDERWKLAFDRVDGQLRFDEGGFVADRLQVRHDGAPATLSLRAGPHVRDPAQAFEADLQLQAGIDTLLDKAEAVQWLKPHARGRSAWTAGLAVARGSGGEGGPALLRLRSSLAGTALDLPEPLRKPAARALPTEVVLRLPLERGEVEVTMGDLLSLRSRSDAGGTGLRVRLGGGRAEAPPARGLAVGGRAARLDALDWLGLVGGGGEGGLPLRGIDVTAAQLHLLGADFPDARVQVAPAPRGTAVQVQAASIAGALLVPQQDGATVAGRFERLYWTSPAQAAAPSPDGVPPAAAAPAQQPGATAAQAPASGFDPATVPPLLFEVADLRIGGTPMGQSRLRSSPTPAGLRLDEFRTYGGKQRLSASGSWTGRGAAARTRLALDVDSDDFGALLSGFGLGGQVAGGKGKLGASMNWHGGPDAFSLATLDAAVGVDAGGGRLLEIEPGAGRVLGLLGVAQLPRRLTLDFRDFFDKGFAFDSIRGDIRVAGGAAHTDNLVIRGPAAEIRVRGDADLRGQRFDQTVEVLPKSGGLLTAVGALAGGPVGAAVGAVANAVLDKPMQGIGAKTYRVTGPWASPKVEAIERDGPQARQKPEQPVEPPG